ncbi:glycosyltransferase family 61 protein [Candidatus Dependentiae bacterium]|nr:glycosyltransferase family 61 protein [Candidatus Dependentiae bacterium]
MNNNNFFKFWYLLIIFYSDVLIAKKYIKKKCAIDFNKDYVNQVAWFKIDSLQKVLLDNPEILYTKIIEPLDFEYSKFDYTNKFPHKGSFKELFILSIPQGVVQGNEGYVFIHDRMIEELIWRQRYDNFYKFIYKKYDFIPLSIPGRVAVIAQQGGDHYFHFVYESLGRLALLEIAEIEYDKLYVFSDKKHIRDLLDLWGIENHKIIIPHDDKFTLRAEELIVPSLVIDTDVGYNFAGLFINPTIINYVRKKLLNSLEQKNLIYNNACKKIFISRKDGNFPRKILNEDEVFALFEAKGFRRYVLSEMSIYEQINLFANADIVVSEHGAGLTNILFCKEKTKIVEIFHSLIDNAYWMTSQVLGLDYKPYLVAPVNIRYFTDLKKYFPEYAKAGKGQTVVSLEKIKKIIEDIEGFCEESK